MERDYLGKALDIAVRLTVIAVIILSAFRIFSPFLTAVVWGVVIAIALYPVFDKMKGALGGRNRLAGTLFILISLALVITPTVMLTGSVVDGAKQLDQGLEDGTLKVPPPAEKVQNWPVVGKPLYQTWYSASVNLEATLKKLDPQLDKLKAKIASTVAGLGAAIVQTIFSLIIAGILMMTSEGGGKVAREIATRLAGADGPPMVDTSIDTIRSVVKGVILVAAIQSLLSAIGMIVAGVPAAGLWAALVLIVAIIQLPPILILGPIAVYVFSANDNTVIAVGFLIWSLIISGSDGFLKPLFLGRGVKVPMLVILIGAIGGMIRGGVIGLFIGPVILAIGYQLFKAWVTDDEAAAQTTAAPETTS
jgi:predicted PurR-regulated permease PerM